jgi:hypothetical protein
VNHALAKLSFLAVRFYLTKKMSTRPFVSIMALPWLSKVLLRCWVAIMFECHYLLDNSISFTSFRHLFMSRTWLLICVRQLRSSRPLPLSRPSIMAVVTLFRLLWILATFLLRHKKRDFWRRLSLNTSCYTLVTWLSGSHSSCLIFSTAFSLHRNIVTHTTIILSLLHTWWLWSCVDVNLMVH